MHFHTPHIEGYFLKIAKQNIWDALEKEIREGRLTKEELSLRKLMVRALERISVRDLHSSLFYLAQAIREDMDRTNPSIRQQWNTELSVFLATQNGAHPVPFIAEGESLFSLQLNQRIPKGTEWLWTKGAEMHWKGAQGEGVFLPIPYFLKEHVSIAVEDHNPFNIHNEHPDVAFVAYDLGGYTREEWYAQFQEGFHLVHQYTPDIYGEVTPFLDTIVPMGYKPEQQMSSSYSHCPGILYLSYTDYVEKQAEALIHEIQHTIFAIIERTAPLLEHDMTLEFYSAYRPDARHMRGCFLGLHAFAPVQKFYTRMLTQRGEFPMKERVLKSLFSFSLKNELVIVMMERHARLTNAGRLLFEDCKERRREAEAEEMTLREEYATIFLQVKEEAYAHLEEAKRTYPTMKY